MTGPCAKTTVRCTLVTTAGDHIVGENWCANPQPVCPRAPGEDYTKCTTVCQQEGHAEAVAVRIAGPQARGARAYLSGHTYACMACQHTMFGAGVAAFGIGDPPKGNTMTIKDDLLRAAAYIGANNDSPDSEASIDSAEADRIAGVLRALAAPVVPSVEPVAWIVTRARRIIAVLEANRTTPTDNVIRVLYDMAEALSPGTKQVHLAASGNEAPCGVEADKARNSARYRWLRGRLLAADFAWGDPPVPVLVFAWPKDVAIGGDCDMNIDAAMRADNTIPDIGIPASASKLTEAAAAPTKIEPGSDLHLTLLMAPYSLNFVVGEDRKALLSWARDVWKAAQSEQRGRDAEIAARHYIPGHTVAGPHFAAACAAAIAEPKGQK